MKNAGSLARGRRTTDETPDIPGEADLDDLEQQAQRLLAEMVNSVGGRMGGGRQIPVAHLDILTDLLERSGRSEAVMKDGQLVFSGRPGLWHVLDHLYPLQDPNRWDTLRAAVVDQLETKRGWRRVSPPRGSAFVIPHATGYSGLTGQLRRSADWVRRTTRL